MSDIEKVKKLREETGAGFKDCNLAIKESNGDLDKAIEFLRVNGVGPSKLKKWALPFMDIVTNHLNEN